MDTACIDGVLVPLSEARIPVTDDGLLRGDGVFEVLRLYDGVPLAAEQHLQRMSRSAAELRLDLDIAAVARDIEALLATAERGDALVRVVATRGGRRIVLTEPLPVPPESMALGYVTFAPVRVLDGVKSLSYAANMQATRLARERGFDEALLVTPHGRVLELPTASFFWVADGEARTPPLSDHILDSITRGIVMEAAEATEVSATPADLEFADEAFAVSSVWEVMPVSRIEERELVVGGSVTGAIAGELRARIEERLSRGG
jgi:branched-chain amino acid aminotransferase